MRHLLRRISFYLVAAWASITLNFLIPRLAPGDPAQALLLRLQQKGPVSPTALAALEAAFGLKTHEPLWAQYLDYVHNLFTGNLGISITNYPHGVSEVLGQNIMWTVVLGGVAVLISFVAGSLIGMIMAWKRNSALDTFLSPAMTFLSGIPYFWLALLIVYVFGFTLNWFPFSDGYDASSYDIGWDIDFITNAAYHAVLPALTIVLSSIAGWMLSMRNTMITTLSEDYIQMARAKGLTSRRIMFAYAARNAILPNITGFAIALGFIVSGQLLTEIVFSYPGIGLSLLNAVQGRDYALVQGIFLLITLAVLGANLLVDLFYTVLDPRVRR